jgi:hypothetical protein
MRGVRREQQHRLAFQQAAEGEDPVAMGGDERREAQAVDAARPRSALMGANLRAPAQQEPEDHADGRGGADDGPGILANQLCGDVAELGELLLHFVIFSVTALVVMVRLQVGKEPAVFLAFISCSPSGWLVWS